MDELTPKTASEYHKKSPKQRVESNFFKMKTRAVSDIQIVDMSLLQVLDRPTTKVVLSQGTVRPRFLSPCAQSR